MPPNGELAGNVLGGAAAAAFIKSLSVLPVGLVRSDHVSCSDRDFDNSRIENAHHPILTLSSHCLSGVEENRIRGVDSDFEERRRCTGCKGNKATAETTSSSDERLAWVVGGCRNYRVILWAMSQYGTSVCFGEETSPPC